MNAPLPVDPDGPDRADRPDRPGEAEAAPPLGDRPGEAETAPPDGEAPGNAPTVVARFSFLHEAELFRSALHAEGIDADLWDAGLITADWLYSQALGGVKVVVRARDAAAAAALLAKLHAPPEPVREDECPRCGVANADWVQPGRRATFLTWLLFQVPLFPPLRRLRCRACGHVFKPGPPPPGPPPRRASGGRAP